MSYVNTRRFVAHTSGQNVYGIVRSNADGTVWDGVVGEFVAYVNGNFDDYKIACTEQGTSGTYEFVMPGAIVEGVYDIEFRARSGASADPADAVIDAGVVEWSGLSFDTVAGVLANRDSEVLTGSLTRRQIEALNVAFGLGWQKREDHGDGTFTISFSRPGGNNGAPTVIARTVNQFGVSVEATEINPENL